MPTSLPTPTSPSHLGLTTQTLKDLLEQEVYFNTTDMEIGIRQSPNTAVPGQAILYSLTVTNNGPNPAGYVRVTAALPQGGA